MKVSAMICELNPLHNGHLHVIERMRRDDPEAVILLVMSGNFTQRSLPAIFDKYSRARAAVMCGADLVVELMFPFSSATGEHFGRAGVQIAEDLGASKLYFGSECGDIDHIRRIAEITSGDEYRAVCENISRDDPTLGAAAVRSLALSRLIPGYASDRVETPNDTLAAQYLRFAEIECVAVRRIETASASDIRAMDADSVSPLVPSASAELFQNCARSREGIFRRILWENLRLCRDDIGAFAECGGGLGDRLVRIAAESTSGEEFFAAAATKRYTNSRIMRAALFALLGVTDADLRSKVNFTSLLASSARGRELVASMRKNSALTIVTKPAHAERAASSLGADAERAMRLGRLADELYTLCFDPAYDAGYFRRSRPYVG